MECTHIPYRRVPKISALYLDYLYHFDRVAKFYNGSPFEVASYREAARQLNGSNKSRHELLETLTKQNEAFGCGESTFANIERLRAPGTFAVVTGQQVGLFSGPAFTLYKALTAVRLSQALCEQGLPSVPVFWLATDDHDLEEVAQAAVLDEDYNLIFLKDSGERLAPRSSVNYVKLSSEVNATLGQLQAALPAGEPRDRLLHDLRASYQPGATWGQAFGQFMARLFHRWGVVLVDALDDSIHRLSASVYEQVITRAAELRERLQERSRQLVRDGYHAQVHVAEDSTLIFVAREGNRTALHHRAGEYFLGDAQKVSLGDLQKAVASHPTDLSPNALLRPVVQDTLLPTVAYVAGPSELAYLGQAHTIYTALGRPLPVVFPRAGFTLVDRRTQRLMEKYRLVVEDVWQGEEHLSRKIAAAGFAEGWSERLDQGEQDLARLLERLRDDIEKLDPTLLDTLGHAEEKMKYQMERVRGKISRAALQRSEMLNRHEQALLRFLTPRKNLQEREVSGIYFLGRAGYELLDRILGQIQTRPSDHQVLFY